MRFKVFLIALGSYALGAAALPNGTPVPWAISTSADFEIP
jgi:hypothetical protein